MLGKRGQASLEYAIIVGILMVILIPLFYYALHRSSETVKSSQAEDAVNSLAAAADEVYSLSPGTKKYVWINIPAGVTSAQIQNATEISLRLGVYDQTGDIVSITKAPIVGTIPTAKGTYRIAVELLDSGIVQIGSGNDTTPPIIVWTSPSGQVCNPITLRANTNEPARCKFDTTDKTYDTLAFTMFGNSLGHNYEQGVQAEGNYLYYVRCADAFNNKMASSKSINYSINYSTCIQLAPVPTLDKTPPNVSLVNPAAGFVSASSQLNFFYNVTDNSSILLCKLLANVSPALSLTILGTAANPLRNITNNITGSMDKGDYSWSVNCTDAAGNEGASTSRLIRINATKDSDVPVVNLTLPLNGSVKKFNLINFFYNTTDNTSGIKSCTISVYSVIDDAGSSQQQLTSFSVTEVKQQNFSMMLQKGNHTWNVSCIDDSIYANIGISNTRSLHVNTTPAEVFITSCAGQCQYNGYSNGICRQEPPKCKANNEIYIADGDIFCTGGAQSDTCCCPP